jgi:hypothetical protein
MNIVIIEKTGDIKTLKMKGDIDISNFYKSCKFRKNKDFDKRHTWKLTDDIYISVFSKNSGRASTENKYDLPPPIDNDLYFGNMALVCHSDEELTNTNLINFTKEKWEICYEKLMGGFEDLGDEDSYSDEEYVDPENLTKQGYDKSDGFIVDDDDSLEVMDDDDNDDEYIPLGDSTEDEEEEEESLEENLEDSLEESTEEEAEEEEEEEEGGDKLNELSEEDYEY